MSVVVAMIVAVSARGSNRALLRVRAPMLGTGLDKGTR